MTRLSLIAASVLVLLTSLASRASQLTLIYTDTFTIQDSIYLASSSPAFFGGNTPFKVVATFETTAPIFHLPGFNAYTPISAVLTVGSMSYTMTDASVSIFDRTNPFFPNRFAAGFIQKSRARSSRVCCRLYFG